MDHAGLTAAEMRTLRLVASGGGKATWYQVARLVTPPEYPGEDTNAVRLLGRLEAQGLVAKTEKIEKMQCYTATAQGVALVDTPTLVSGITA